MSESIATIDKFPYGITFQTVLLGIVYRDPGSYNQLESVLQPSYFDRDEFKHLCRIIVSYYKDYSNTPTAEFCSDLIVQYCLIKRFSDSIKERLLEAVEQVLTVDLSGTDWVRDKALEFATAQSLKAAIVSGAKDLNDPSKYSEILARIEKALDISSPKNNGINFREVALSLPEYMRDNSLYASHRKIPTGIPTLDDHMFGGAACGKIGVIMAPSGAGKTHTLVSFAANAMRCGHAVFHYTFGDLQVEEVFARYAANFSGIDSRKIVEGVGPDYRAAMTRWLEDNLSELLIFYFPADALTPSGLKSHISATIARTGIRPKVIVVDYADQLNTGLPTTVKSDEISMAIGHVYNQLIKIAYTFDAVVWTGSQVAKDHWRDDVIDSDAIARSAKKIDHSDYIFTLSQTKEDANLGKAKLFEAKIRWGTDKHLVFINLDKKLSRLTEDDRPPEQQLQKKSERFNSNRRRLPDPSELGIENEEREEHLDNLQRFFNRE